MGLYAEQILPRLLDIGMRGGTFGRLRARVAAGLEGEVLEIGFGSGLNLPHYPDSVTRISAVDPATVGRKLAARRVAASRAPVQYVGLDAEVLAAPDESADHVLCTWTLCTIPDAAAALGEIRRVLRPGGTLRFIEHGLAPDPRVAALQRRLTPLQRRAFGGCHLDRPISDLIAGAGLELGAIDTYYLSRPHALGYMYEGVAVKTG